MASTVIVGSGVMGASAAYHLAVRGHRGVIVLDRASGPGQGTTARATGGFRAQSSTAIDIRLSLLSREKLLAFRRDTGVDPGYVTVGHLWIADSDAHLQTLRAGVRVQLAEGLIEAMELDDERIGWLNPALERSGLAGAVFCPTDGHLEPLAILRGYVEAAARLGVRFEWNTVVERLERAADGSARGVRTAQGMVQADAVVVAAGASTASLARACGLVVPAGFLRRHVAVTAPTDVLPVGMPVTVWAADGFRVSVRNGRVVLFQPAPAAAGAAGARPADRGWIETLSAKAHARVPALRGVAVDRGLSWSAVDEMPPDGHPVLGPVPGCPNCYFARRGSPDDVTHVPALGHLLAEMVLDGRATTLDVTCLHPGRFGAGEPAA